MSEKTDYLIALSEEQQREYLRNQPKCHLVEQTMNLYDQLDKAENRIRVLELENAFLKDTFNVATSN